MSYSVRIKPSAAKELARIAKPDRSRLLQAIDVLAGDTFKGSALKGERRGLRRVGIGAYRSVYGVREEVLVARVVAVDDPVKCAW